MNLQIILGQIAGLVSLVAFLPYIYLVFQKKIKPNIASWIIWTSVNTLVLVSYYESGARTTIWVPLVYVIQDLLIVAFSIRSGYIKWNVLDKMCMIGAVAGIILWLVTKNPVNALLFSLLIDVCGVFPTVRHALQKPHEEFLLSWLLIVLGSLINIFALTSWSFELSVYPIYMFFGNLVILLSLVMGKFYKNRAFIKK